MTPIPPLVLLVLPTHSEPDGRRTPLRTRQDLTVETTLEDVTGVGITVIGFFIITISFFPTFLY